MHEIEFEKIESQSYIICFNCCYSSYKKIKFKICAHLHFYISFILVLLWYWNIIILAFLWKVTIVLLYFLFSLVISSQRRGIYDLETYFDYWIFLPPLRKINSQRISLGKLDIGNSPRLMVFTYHGVKCYFVCSALLRLQFSDILNKQNSHFNLKSSLNKILAEYNFSRY